MTAYAFRLPRCLSAAMVLAIGACTAEVAGPADYTVAVGQQLDITRGTIGPGNPYDTIPHISSAVVRFLGVTEPSALRNPGGPTQVFRFEAQTPGRATITFRKSGASPVVSDMVVVEVQ